MTASWLRFLLTLAMICPAVAGHAITDDEVQVDYRDGLYVATLRLKTPAPPTVALAVLTDFEHMADFMPGVLASRIVSARACPEFCVNGVLVKGCSSGLRTGW